MLQTETNRKNTKDFYLRIQKIFFVNFYRLYIANVKPVTMEFDATIQGVHYNFNFINSTSVLISGHNAEYILYKTKQWQCADVIKPALLKSLGNAIEDHLNVKSY